MRKKGAFQWGTFLAIVILAIAVSLVLVFLFNVNLLKYLGFAPDYQVPEDELVETIMEIGVDGERIEGPKEVVVAIAGAKDFYGGWWSGYDRKIYLGDKEDEKNYLWIYIDAESKLPYPISTHIPGVGGDTVVGKIRQEGQYKVLRFNSDFKILQICSETYKIKDCSKVLSLEGAFYWKDIPRLFTKLESEVEKSEE